MNATIIFVLLLALMLTWAFAVGVRRDLVRVERRMDALARHDPVTGVRRRLGVNWDITERVASEQAARTASAAASPSAGAHTKSATRSSPSASVLSCASSQRFTSSPPP